jgi:hypothetical protein
MPAATANFKITSWDEKTVHELAGHPKLTHAAVTKAFEGDMQGESTIDYLMAYPAAARASFVGIERFVGTLGGRKGSFAIKHDGTYDNGIASTAFTIVPGTGTGELKGISGGGNMAIGHAESYPMTFEYDFAD